MSEANHLSIDVKTTTSKVSDEKEDWYGQHQWQCGYERGWDAAMENSREFECPRCGHCCQQREWVGLTDEERHELNNFRGLMPFIHAIEAKLKEKNT